MNELTATDSIIRNSPSAIRHPQSQIYLVGFMASGKSTIGPLLAAKLERPFIDLDQLIEKQAHRSIFDLVRQEGEARFRQLETQTLRAAAQAEAAIIAPGGGAITRTENREVMQTTGVTIWLDAPFALCWQRIQRDGATRPLAPDEAVAQARYAERLPLYQQATFRIPIHEALSAEAVAAECWRQLKQL
jgi:shikimate kinase